MTWLGRIRGLGPALLLAACVVNVEDMEPGAGSSLALNESDEGGLWMAMEQAEEALVSSGRLVDDPVLTGYVEEVACRVAAAYCQDLRVYIVRHAGFNASMAPNGFMMVWTGLLLRIENEAQLASILGHEVAHYRKRHALERWRSMRATLDASAFLGVATMGLGVGVVGSIGQLAAVGHLMSFGRDQEREADELGLQAMASAGYDAEQAIKVWEIVIAEKLAADRDEPSPFMASHPGSEERLITLRQQTKGLRPAASQGEIGTERFEQIIAPWRGKWVEDELKAQRFAEMALIIERWRANARLSGEAEYYLAEMYRRRDEEGDRENAVKAYRNALALPGAPPEAHRGLGLVLWTMEDHAGAREAFEAYTALKPEAEDAAIIRSYIERLGETLS